MGKCRLCNKSSKFISDSPGLCLQCIRNVPHEALEVAIDSHRKSRAEFGLPAEPPRAEDGIKCSICVNECRIPEGAYGYCGLRRNEKGRLVGVSSQEGKLSWYYDPLPTNCVADWVCAGGTGAGYPEYAYNKGPEYGYKNLAVFFHACTLNCLYCQNWHFREETFRPGTRTAEDLVVAIDNKTSCICYFGGDPTPQIPFALNVSRRAIKRHKNRILRICWETNGTMNRVFLNEMIEISLQTGGTIKFDLKAWDDVLHKVLTGVTNERTIENFACAATKSKKRPSPPLIAASTLLVPGYIDEKEIRGIAKFIASIDPDIPYSLLAFYPHFHMKDLPLTSKELAYRCLHVAQKEGLRQVRIGNISLLR
jgi:pyruvate formate lyase activating enzyme